MNKFDLDAINIEDFDADNETEKTDYINNEYKSDDEDYSLDIKTVSNDKGDFAPITEDEYKILKAQHKLSKLSFDKVFLMPEEKSKEVRDENISAKNIVPNKTQEKSEKARTLIVDTEEWIVDCITEGVSTLEKISPNKERVRVYNKKVEMPKITYRKPTENKSPIAKLLLFFAACCGAGGFLGYMANSYYVYKERVVTSTLSCAFSWLMEEKMPYTLNPFYFNVFGTAFLCGFGILAVIGLFIWLDGDAKKQSRVGNEHGKARLSKPSDFKVYRNRFME